MKEKIEFPKSIDVTLENQTITLTKNDVSETKKFKCKDADFSIQGNALILKGYNEKKKTNAVIHTVKKHLQNLVTGLEKGYQYKMKVVYSHFPMNLQVSGNQIIINNFAGEKKPRKALIVGNNTKVKAKGKTVILTGPNKEHLGQTAANLEKVTTQKGKDERIFQDGIYLVEKGIKETEEEQ